MAMQGVASAAPFVVLPEDNMTDDKVILLLPDPRPEFNHTYTREEWDVLVACGHGDRQFWGEQKQHADSMVAKGHMRVSTDFFPDGRYLVTDKGWRLLDWH